MKKLQPFLHKYDIIIFDMDGVITSEQYYWHTSALVIYEMFNSSQYFGGGKIDIDYAMNNYVRLTKEILCDGKTIATLKNKGVNSNWDLVYVVICIVLILGKVDYEAVYEYAQTLSDNALAIYEELGDRLHQTTGKPLEWCERGGEMWTMAVENFQDWYLGSEQKPGMIVHETSLLPLDDLKEIFEALVSSGKSLGFGTGRIAYEVEFPLKKWGFEKYFDKNRWISYDTVQAGETELNASGYDVTLTKPHPYVFLKGLYGSDYSNKKLIDGDYDKSLIPKLLVVGDAGADILAAQAMDADFCAVLTGVSGQAAREYFEEMQATYILDCVADFLF